jgi:hypothetical protein
VNDFLNLGVVHASKDPYHTHPTGWVTYCGLTVQEFHEAMSHGASWGRTPSEATCPGCLQAMLPPSRRRRDVEEWLSR